ncbi:mast cell protease 1A isoform X1 [Caretta caretta]|uniref:mast cell protease 1A isoform X1 n=1 Tax=Caretta caretta TaxID=8467 RepID=UPI003D5B998D
MKVQILLLLPMAFLLPPGAWAGEIIGGQEAQPHSRPYMANLEIRRGDKSYRCGGFLVKTNFVLTAAHCKGDEITVTLGAHNIRQRERSQQKIPVRRQILHPRYNRDTISNDIMLLQLQHKARLTEEVGLIDLTSAHRRVRPGTMCSVAGWGRTSLTDTPNTLQEVNLLVISDETCYKRYRYYYPSSMLCAGDPDDQKSIYLGDSGGPLVCRGVAEGIVSKCIRNSIRPPAVYTRISHFMPWITDTMRGI